MYVCRDLASQYCSNAAKAICLSISFSRTGSILRGLSAAHQFWSEQSYQQPSNLTRDLMTTTNVHKPMFDTASCSLLPPRSPWQICIWTRAGQIQMHNFPCAQSQCHKARRNDAKGTSAVWLRLPREGGQDAGHGSIALGAGDKVPHGCDGVKTIVSLVDNSLNCGTEVFRYLVLGGTHWSWDVDCRRSEEAFAFPRNGVLGGRKGEPAAGRPTPRRRWKVELSN